MSKQSRADSLPVPIVDRNNQPGAVYRLLVLGLVMAGSAAIIVIYKEFLGEPVLLAVLGILAMIGVFYLFASAMGFVQVTPRSIGDELAKAYVDSLTQGLMVADPNGQIVYANEAYAKLTGADSAAHLKLLPDLLEARDEATMTLDAIAKRVADGQQGEGEFRLSSRLDNQLSGEPCWYRVRSRSFEMSPISQAV